MKDASPLLTPTQAAERAGISRQAIYLWIRRGLPVEYQGLQYRIRQGALDRWMDLQRQAKGAA